MALRAAVRCARGLRGGGSGRGAGGVRSGEEPGCGARRGGAGILRVRTRGAHLPLVQVRAPERTVISMDAVVVSH